MHRSIRRADGRAVGALLLAIGIVASSTASAQEDPSQSQVRFEWSRAATVEGCPSGESLREQVAARLGRNPFGPAPTRIIEAHVTHDDAFVATLLVRSVDGEVIGRRELTVDEPTCDALAEAVILTVALTIDPNARLAPASSPPPQPSSPPPPTPCPSPPPRDPPSAPSPPPSSLAVSAWIGAEGAIGILPRAGLAPRLGASLEIERVVAVEASFVMLPEQRAADAAFGLASAGLAGCVVPFEGPLRVLGCAGVRLGALHQVVYAPDPVAPGQRLWAAGVVRAVLDVLIAQPFVMRAEIGVVVPFVRDTFVTTEGAEIFQVPAVGGLAQLAIGARVD